MNLSHLPIQVPYLPMEAKSVAQIPKGAEWQYEPKWDGFRCLAFRDGDTVELQSKSGESLTRYFPELVQALTALRAKRFVLDGEIVLFIDGRLSFDDLLQRIHPAESRVRKLSVEHPVKLVLFDLLVDDKGKLVATDVFAKRRKDLEHFISRYVDSDEILFLSPATRELENAETWLETMRGQLDGVVAKRLDLPYQSGERAMLKIKDLRTADCVVGGFRYGAREKLVGSLLLGLYDEQGLLHHVGFTSSIAAAERPALTEKLEALIGKPGFTGRSPGGPSRWSTAKSADWQPLRPELVVEVRYDHFTGQRFRHGTKLMRWRPDKSPRQCLLSQLEGESASPLGLIA
ncbi:ATP-dependent DNA ligase [Bryobacter aggregatus]|uniref:ATP-dependent DNA ligase n=1 Tax=Bryobacter aggregatus TaxID=360054 RepID=UPI0009B5ACA3|nr:ATP-dependent DNA ligase [Bryobacter aggregatus]